MSPGVLDSRGARTHPRVSAAAVRGSGPVRQPAALPSPAPAASRSAASRPLPADAPALVQRALASAPCPHALVCPDADHGLQSHVCCDPGWPLRTLGCRNDAACGARCWCGPLRRPGSSSAPVGVASCTLPPTPAAGGCAVALVALPGSGGVIAHTVRRGHRVVGVVGREHGGQSRQAVFACELGRVGSAAGPSTRLGTLVGRAARMGRPWRPWARMSSRTMTLSGSWTTSGPAACALTAPSLGVVWAPGRDQRGCRPGHLLWPVRQPWRARLNPARPCGGLSRPCPGQLFSARASHSERLPSPAASARWIWLGLTLDHGWPGP